MTHEIINKKLQLSIKTTGAEICSVKSVLTGREFIWDANPEIWANHAPILFPIVGALKNGAYFYKGKSYLLPQHGFFRHNSAIELIEKTSDTLSFGLKSNEELLKVYPFDFEFITIYQLKDNSIIITHKVLNPANEEMYFSVGTHPAFKCPINKGETYSDYYLEFEKNENSKSWMLDGNVIGDETKEVFEIPNIINLHPNIFDEGALVFKDLKSKKISLKSKKSDQIITISYKGFPYMGIWSKPQADFVCIEPWLGIADSINSNQDFTTKEGIIKLDGGKTFEVSYSIEISE